LTYDDSGRVPSPPPMPPGGWPPPQQHLPLKKKRGAGLILGIVAVVLLLLCGIGVIVAVSSNGNNSSNSSNGNSSNSSSGGGGGVGSGANNAQGAKHAKVGEAARDGKFEFTVASIKCGVAEVGTSGIGKTAQGQFCLVSVTVKNIGTKPQTFDSSSQKAKGANGASYSSDGTAELYANSNAQTFLNEINPGNQAVGVMVFDIPKDATIASLELHDSPFSGGVTVDVA
jgi:hypothetical protein